MEPQEPKPPDSHEPDPADDALRRLEERLGRASEAAERLIGEAAGSVRAAASGRRSESAPPRDESRPAGAHAGGEAGSARAGDNPEAGSARAGDNPDAGSAPAGDNPDAGSAPAGSDADAIPMPPPAGWQLPPRDEDRRRDGDLEMLIQVIHAMRELIPPDLQLRLAEALRELLLAIRALIDWYLERSEQRRPTGGEVQDIPIM